MRILLTGASGYLGLHALSALTAAGHHVTALVRSADRLGSFAQHEAVTVEVGDLTEHESFPSLVAGQDAVVHTALIWGRPEDDLELADTVATAKLFEAAGASGVGRAVYVSSTAVHRPFAGRMRETDALTPADVYAATKAAGESFLWSACGSHRMTGVVLRSGPIVGGPAVDGGAFQSNRRLREFVGRAKLGEPVHAPPGGRQFVAAGDMARAIQAAVESPSAAGTYLVVEREVRAWSEVAQHAVSRLDSESTVVVRARDEDDRPRFDDTRIVELLGAPLDATVALNEHIAHLTGG